MWSSTGPKPQIGSLAEAHHFLRDNEYILSGYRIYFNSTRRILKSLFMLHNESANVWSHLAGVVLFFILMGYTIFMLDIDPAAIASQMASAVTARISEGAIEHIYLNVCSSVEQFVVDLKGCIVDSAQGSWAYLSVLVSSILTKLCDGGGDTSPSLHALTAMPIPVHVVRRWPIFIFILAALFCLGCSTFYHLFNAHSEKVHALTSRLDYAGISLLISGSYYPVIYYIYFCRVDMIVIFLAGISVSATLVFAVSLTDSFQLPRYRTLRGMTFLALGLLGTIPLLHIAFFMPVEVSYFRSSIIYFMLMACSYVTGVLIYVSRVPERFIPGKFDLLGNSHNIWHCFVVAAAIWHYVGSVDAYHLRGLLECPAA